MQQDTDPLASTWSMLEHAFPTGVKEHDVAPLLRILYDHMSDRQLRRVVMRLTDLDEGSALNRVYEIANMSFPREALASLEEALRSAGFEEWAAEG